MARALKLVRTNREWPTPENSQPIGGTEGRGSMVWFNMATMLQSSETGFLILKEASAAGVPDTYDFKGTAQEAFTKYKCFFHLK